MFANGRHSSYLCTNYKSYCMTSQSTPCPFTIRIATPADAPALVEIYRPYVERTAITFEYDVPSVADFAQRIARTLERHPYLVAEDADGNIVG